MTNKRVNIITISLLLFIIIFLFVLSVFPNNIIPSFHLINESTHTAIEVLSNGIFVLIIPILYIRSFEENNSWYFPLSISFLYMGIMGIIHALTTPGNTFVFLHSSAVLIGSLCFLAVLLPQGFFEHLNKNKIFIVSILILLFFLVLIPIYPQLIPKMFVNNKFTYTAICITFIYGLFFTLSAIRFLFWFKNKPELEYILFAGFSLIMGISGLSLTYSHIWDNVWWVWHISKFIASLLIAIVLIFAYFKTANLLILQNEELLTKKKELIDHKNNLEHKVKEQTIHLQKLVEDLQNKEEELIVQNNELQTKEEELIAQNNELQTKEEKLLKSNSFLNSISNTALDAIIMIDSYGKVLHWNNAAEKIFGFTLPEVINKNLHDFIMPEIYKNDYNNALKFFQETGKGSVIDKIVELRALNKNNTEIDVELAVSSLNIDDKWCAVGIVRDISKRKEVENNMNLTLQKLAEANLKLQEAHKHKDFFLSTMSHELRTPLNAILGLSQALEKQYFGKLNEKQIEYILDIYNSGQHLLELINDILDIAKIDAGTVNLLFESTPLNDAIQDSLSMIKPQCNNKNITLSYNIESNINYIKVDIRRFKQILLNLLSNAVKYTGTNGIIEVDVRKIDQNYIKISITDNGIGIKKEDLENIFSEFYQSDHTRDQALGGTGIGLALCKRLVQLHKGEIGVESKYNKGSKFWFSLPID